ncbi:MAG: AIR carboxylase family protein [Candidatus Doudnabacteria bacterium]
MDPQVYVIVGSESDLKSVANSKLEEIFRKLGIVFEVNVISAHRNPLELSALCDHLDGPSKVFIAAAGWAAALAGAISANTQGWLPVIGVPLPGGPYGPQDSLYAMASMPPGRPVMVVPNLDNAALAAAQILSFASEEGREVRQKLCEYLAETTKPTKRNVNLDNFRTKEKK